MSEQETGSKEELYTPESVLKWLNFAGNDERKLIILLAIAEAGEPLGRTALYRELNDRAGAGGIPGVESGPIFACRKSLSKTGGINFTQTEISRPWPQVVPAVEITEEGLAMVPFAGALLDWSSNHPELRLRAIFGDNAPGDSLRYQTLYDLAVLSDAGESLSIDHVAPYSNVSRTSRQTAIDRLVQAGIVEKESIMESNKSTFTILQPDYINKPRKRPFDKLLPETQLLYKTFQAAHAIRSEWSVEGFFAFMKQTYPDMDEQVMYRARQRLTHGLTSGDRFKGVLDYTGGKYLNNTEVHLASASADAVIELINLIDAFCSGETDVIELGRQKAKDIINSPGTVSSLYGKAYEGSLKAHGDQEFDKRLIEIVRRSGASLTAKAIMAAYIESSGRKVSFKTIDTRLGELKNSGQLVAVLQPKSGFNKQPVLGYRSSESISQR